MVKVIQCRLSGRQEQLWRAGWAELQSPASRCHSIALAEFHRTAVIVPAFPEARRQREPMTQRSTPFRV